MRGCASVCPTGRHSRAPPLERVSRRRCFSRLRPGETREARFPHQKHRALRELCSKIPIFSRIFPCSSHILSFANLKIFTQVKLPHHLQVFVILCVIVQKSFFLFSNYFPLSIISHPEFFTGGVFALQIYKNVRDFVLSHWF